MQLILNGEYQKVSLQALSVAFAGWCTTCAGKAGPTSAKAWIAALLASCKLSASSM
jgi:hypothetical protein